MPHLSDEEFEGAIQDALDAMPQQFLDELENVVIMAQDEPEDWQLEEDVDGLYTEDGDMLGLYDGVSIYERGADYGMGDYPDCITIFKGAHERLGGTKAQILEEVRKTVVHEVGHYFGMDEAQLDAMGYGDPEVGY